MSLRFLPLLLALALPATAQTTYTVTTAADDGAGSLRQAIVDANANDGPDVIAFDIDGGGAYAEVFLQTRLPIVTGPVTLDGGTQGCDTSEGLCVRLDGDAIAPANDGLDTGLIIEGNDSVIRGLTFTRFYFFAEGTTALALASTNNRVAGCYFGTDRTGMVTDPDGTPGSGDELGNGFGLAIAQYTEQAPPAVDNVVGGTEPGDRNVFAGSFFSGVIIRDATTVRNRVVGNYIGTNAAGTAPLGNGENGLLFGSDASLNVVEGNTISGNVSSGIRLQTRATENTIRGNLIGTDPTGQVAIPNGTLAGLASFFGNGIEITDASRNVVEDNTISGNLLAGVIIGFLNLSGEPGPLVTADNVVRGNRIGTDADGEAPIPNGVPGVADVGFGVALVSGFNTSTTGNVIGGSEDGDANVIAFNTSAGVGAQGDAVSGNVIDGNLIGITADEEPGPNGQVGILFRVAAALGQTTGPFGNQIGDDDPDDFEEDVIGNAIAFQPVGIALAPGTAGNDVAFNTFGGAPGAFLPVDLGPDGPTANDPGDADGGPNRFQNSPVILEAPIDDDEITVRYQVDTATENAAYPLTVRFYGVIVEDGLQGYLPLGSAAYAAPGEATATFENSIDGRPRIVATATDADGNTSEVTLMGVAVSGEGAPGVAEAVRVGPNPTAGPLRFAFELAAPAEVSVAVYDMLGRAVATVDEVVLEAGAHDIPFDAALPAGVYVWRLSAGDRVEAGRVTVVR